MGESAGSGNSVIDEAGFPLQKGGQLWPAERAALDAMILARYFRARSRSQIAGELGISKKRVTKRLQAHGQTGAALAKAMGMRLKWDRKSGSYKLVPRPAAPNPAPVSPRTGRWLLAAVFLLAYLLGFVGGRRSAP